MHGSLRGSALSPGALCGDRQRVSSLRTARASAGAARRPRPALRRAALDQEAITQAPAVFVFTAVYARISRKYGEARAPRYVHLEVGHAAQNLLLEAAALGLGGVPIGALDDAALQEVLPVPADHHPHYLIPTGDPL